jgi:hypothetical protein
MAPAGRRIQGALAWAAVIIVGLGLATLARTLVRAPAAERRVADAADERAPARTASAPAGQAVESAPAVPVPLAKAPLAQASRAEPMGAAGAPSPAEPRVAAAARPLASADAPRLALEAPVAADAGARRALDRRDSADSPGQPARIAAAAPARPTAAVAPAAPAPPVAAAQAAAPAASATLGDRAADRDSARPTQAEGLAARSDIAPRARELAKSRAAVAAEATPPQAKAAAGRPDRRRAAAEVMLGTRIRLIPGLPLLDVLVVHDPSGRVAAAALQRLPSGDTIEIVQRPDAPPPAAAPPVAARVEALPPARADASALSVTRDGVSLTLRAAVPPDSLVTLLERIR